MCWTKVTETLTITVIMDLNESVALISEDELPCQKSEKTTQSHSSVFILEFNNLWLNSIEISMCTISIYCKAIKVLKSNL